MYSDHGIICAYASRMLSRHYAIIIVRMSKARKLAIRKTLTMVP